MANLPTDIILVEILPRCAAKKLLQFKCVCKSFNTLISSSKFINFHLRLCCYNPNRFLVLDYGRKSRIPNGICCVELRSLGSPMSSLPLPKILTSNHNNNNKGFINIVGSCNGLLCIAMHDDVRVGKDKDVLFVLLNPCTGMYVPIPSCKEIIHDELRYGFQYVHGSTQVGFGYDPMNSDYKIVVIVDCNIVVGDDFMENIDVANEITREVFVYSLKFKSWTFVEGTSSSRDGVLGGRNGVLINDHLLHWVFKCSETNENRIGCFDLRINQWVEDVPLPDYYKNNSTNWLDFNDKKIEERQLGLLDKCLCLLTENPRDVWIMKDYGIRESWVKLLGASDPQITKSLMFCPLAYRGVTTNEVLVRRMNQKKKFELVWYNIREKKIQRVDQIFKSRKVDDILNAHVCEPSLVKLPGGLKI